jgi:hypothetical protein
MTGDRSCANLPVISKSKAERPGKSAFSRFCPENLRSTRRLGIQVSDATEHCAGGCFLLGVTAGVW